jgi:hypothetical protein
MAQVSAKSFMLCWNPGASTKDVPFPACVYLFLLTLWESFMAQAQSGRAVPALPCFPHGPSRGPRTGKLLRRNLTPS